MGTSDSTSCSEAEAEANLTRLLRVTIAQLQSLEDDVLKFEADVSGAMHDMRTQVDQTLEIITQHSGTERDNSDLPNHLTRLDNSAKQTVISMQFIDSMVQRLAHIQHALREMTSICEEHKGHVPEERWHQMLSSLSKLYSIRKEHDVFNVIMGQSSDSKALSTDSQPDRQSDVELF